MNRLMVPATIGLFLTPTIAQSSQDSHPASAPATQSTTPTTRSEMTPSELFEYASPCVVKLLIKDDDKKVIGTGSGFIAEAEEYTDIMTREGTVYFEGGHPKEVSLFRTTIVTNWHVIRPAVYIDVVYSDGLIGPAYVVVAEDEASDLAVLRADRGPSSRILKLTDRDKPPVGERVFTIGSPKGLQNTLSDGLLSGYRRVNEDIELVQISAPISPGSSGGPLLLSDGSILGITTSYMVSGQNLNFAVPSANVRKVLQHAVLDGAPLRAVWKGASITSAIDDAFGDVARDIFYRDREFPNKDVIISNIDSIRSRGDYLLLLYTAYLQRSEDQYANAIDMLSRIEPDTTSKYRFLDLFLTGWCHYENAIRQNSDFRPAVAILEEAVALTPTFAPARFYLAEAYLKCKQHPEALAEAAAVVQLVPRCYEAYALRGEVWACFNLAKNVEADFAKAVDLRPDDSRLYQKMSIVLSRVKSFQKAIAASMKCIDLNPGDWRSHYTLAFIYRDMGEYQLAISAFQKAAALLPPDAALPRKWIDDEIKTCTLQMDRRR